ncbi:putative ABC transporter integral membrane protein [Nostocoides japonicum T1-X7]|uniref:Putative ABC transporter integral membrane protein n=1 Tax=Nostocoides japonicum T1-X7 TaxID=1194083 RepID=A0A077M3C0_9MICO|nr:putative ABC transporter integral membrane protein [Tetrasphaera japonica T1-X7]
MTTLILGSGGAGGVWHALFDFADYGQLLALVRNSIAAGAILGIVGGLVSSLVMMRDLPFAVHGISELSFAGASVALLVGINVVAGSLVGSVLAAVLIGALGARARSRNSVIGVVMPFGLGVGVLALSLYQGRAANKFGLLTGQIVAVDTPQLAWLAGTAVVVVLGLLVIWRPLLFASTDPELAAARGVPVALLSPVFMLLLGLTVAISVQVIGALLVLSVVCTPAAAALRVTASPRAVPLLSMAFGFVSVVGGILLALGSSVPISPYVTTIAFLIYLLCGGIGRWRAARSGRPSSCSRQRRATTRCAAPPPAQATARLSRRAPSRQR